MLSSGPAGSLNLADVYGQASNAMAMPSIQTSMGPGQSAIAAGVNIFGAQGSGQAPAFALILLIAVLVGMRVAFEFGTK